jgi:pyrimidine-nucleoside phosphorylase
MGKKLASGADAIVLDVKVGAGAFMKTLSDAEALAEELVGIGNLLKKPTTAILSDMNEPLGYEVGNANEIKEVIQVLQGKGEPRLTELCLTIASHMTVLGGAYPTLDEAKTSLIELMKTGQALAAFKAFVGAQGGDVSVIDDPNQLPQAAYTLPFVSEVDGYIQEIQADDVGLSAMKLGAGRATKEASVDHSVGITLLKKVGDKVAKGETLAMIHTNDQDPEEAIQQLKKAYAFSPQPVSPPPIIYKVI